MHKFIILDIDGEMYNTLVVRVKSLIMTIAWSGKRKRSDTIWVFEFYTAFIWKYVMPEKVSTDASYMK